MYFCTTRLSGSKVSNGISSGCGISSGIGSERNGTRFGSLFSLPAFSYCSCMWGIFPESYHLPSETRRAMNGGPYCYSSARNTTEACLQKYYFCGVFCPQFFFCAWKISCCGRFGCCIFVVVAVFCCCCCSSCCSLWFAVVR